MKVLALGFPAELLERLGRYFYDLDIESVDTLEVLQCIPSLLVIEQVALGDDPLGYLDELRKRETPLRAVPIIYCLSPDAYDQAGLATGLVRRLGVKRVLATPVDLPELARSVAAELGIRMRPQPPRAPAARRQTLSALAGLWLKFRASNLARVHSLEMAAEVLQHGELEANARRQVEREMHKLVGSAGTFGFQEASLLAREAESLLAHASVLNGEQRLRLLELAQRIRFQLEGAAPPCAEAASKAQTGKSILVVSDDPEMAGSLPGFTLTRAASNEEARTLVRDQLPGALLLDACSGDLATRVQLLKELSWEFPQLPMLVLTGEQGLHARLALTEMGSVEVLCRPVTAQQISEELRILLERRGQLGVRVLAVDDDPSILEAVKGTLEPMGLAVETLSDPTLFWEALELSSPDLILLDVDMPYLSGLDLCRVLRTDPRWSDRPVLFLTAYFDTNTMQRIYQAGADDYIQKPVVDSELVTRISNRLARTQHYRRLADTDLLTGVATRRVAG
ncbi:response regulator [bacterium CPR1]|nr:response regulator [bacterium CPR1]